MNTVTEKHFLKLVKAILICIGVADHSVKLADSWLQFYRDGYKAHEAVLADYEMNQKIHSAFPNFTWEKTAKILENL